ncbi:MAG: 4,5-dihydroxyphthalate decarboxylase [Chloroflexota bacterium]|jgi:4,5-dihydroxyphthalate decarboxylase|nr:4,5-dihydroxyphthalate decarboxylase [Chloroflexota bacterium]
MLKLRAAFMRNPRIYPIAEGVVKAKDIELDVDPEDHGDLFAWLLDGNPCDVFEFSISHYMTTFERHDPRWDWVALPMFLAKAIPFVETRVHVDSGIESLADIRGKKVGSGDFAMTAAVWLRVAADQLYGVPPQDVSWFAGRARHRSHDMQLGIEETLRPDLSVTWLDDDTALDRMLRAGEIDAAFGVKPDPATRPLFPDHGAALFAEFYKRHGYVPVNHILLVRRQIVDENPWVPEALYEAFEASKRAAYQRDPSTSLVLPEEDAEAQLTLYGPDPYASGVAANRPMLEALARQSYAEGLTQSLLDVDQLFWEGLRNT